MVLTYLYLDKQMVNYLYSEKKPPVIYLPLFSATNGDLPLFRETNGNLPLFWQKNGKLPLFRETNGNQPLFSATLAINYHPLHQN